MAKCSFCGKYIEFTEVFKCRYCGQTFCPKHRLREYHDCFGLNYAKTGGYRAGKPTSHSMLHKTHVREDRSDNPHLQPAPQPQERPNRSPNRPHMNKAYSPSQSQGKVTFSYEPRFRFRRWHYQLIKTAALFILSLLVLITIYNNAEELNKSTIFIFRVGSLLLLTSCIVTIKFGWDFLKKLQLFLGSWVGRAVPILLCLLLALYLYGNQESQTQETGLEVDGINYSYLNPFSIDIAKSSAEAYEASIPEPGFNSQTYEVETLIFQKVNEERGMQGLPKLIWDPMLADIARQHSLDMAKESYFSHDNPEGQGPTERAEDAGIETIKQQGYVYQVGVAENIGMMPTGNVEGYGYVGSPETVADAMMEGWMDSPGHRGNILDSTYGVIGVGVAYDGFSTYYLTQDFQ